MKRSLVIIGSIFIIIALALGASAWGDITSSRNDLTDTAPSISNGDFTAQGSIYFNGEYTQQIKLSLADGVASEAEGTVYEGMVALKGAIDLSKYELTADQLKSLITRVMDSYPDLFHVNNSYSYSLSGGYVYQLKPKYKMTSTEYKNALKVYNAEIDKITTEAGKLSNDLEKILFVHDYIAANYEYDTDYAIYDVYNFIVSKKGVCQSYTLMVQACADKLGIDCSWAQSSEMSHIWNVVKIDGSYYHMDVTWDDPVNGVPYYSGHSNFLLSDNEMLERDHYSWTSDYTCTSSKYDDAFWNGVKAPFVALGEDLYYIDSANKKLMSFDGESFETKTLRDFDYVWNVIGSNSFYSGMWSGLSAYNNVLYINSPEEVFAFVVQTGELLSVYSAETNNSIVYSSLVADGKINVYLATKPDGSGKIVTADFTYLMKNINVVWKYGAESRTHTYSIGDIPVYDGALSDLYVNDEYHSTFKAWDKVPTPLLSATTFTATFENEEHSFTNGVCSCSMEIPDDGPQIMYYGSCSKDGFSWTIDENGVLTVSGEGAMHNTSSWAYNDWWEHRTYVKKLVVSEGITSIGNYAFVGLPFTSVQLPDSLTAIGEGAFKGCTSIEAIELPNNITAISDAAFVNCTALKSITLSTGLKTVGQKAFYGCTALESISIPSGVTVISNSLFYNCKALSSVSLPSGITLIDGYAFYGCKSLGSITLTASLKTVGASAFRGSALTKISLPASLSTVGDHAFYECSRLASVNIPGQMTQISEYAFAKTAIKDISLPGSIKTVQEGAFSYCQDLEKITLQSGLTRIGSSAFAFCEKLKQISLPTGLSSIGELAFHGCTGLTSISIPQSVTSIEKDAFCECTSLGSISLSEGLVSIGERAFAFTPITQITLPKTATTLSDQVFAGCSGLKSIYLEGIEISSGWSSKWTDGCSASVYFKNSVGFNSATVVMESKMTINFLVKKAAFESCDDIYAVFKRYYSDARGTVEITVDEYKVNGDYWVFALTGVAAKEMNDQVDATLFVEKDGILYEYKVIPYGITQYAKNRLSKSNITDKEKVLLVDMLNFGAMAQIYFGYSVDDLANSFLSDEQKAYGSFNVGDDITLSSVKKYVKLEGENVSLASVSAVFEDSVELRYQINLSKYTGDMNNLSVLVTYNDVNGKTHQRVYGYSEMVKSGSYYTITFGDVAIKDMGMVITTTVYENYGTENEKAVSGTATYSVESYAASMKNASDSKLVNLVCHMIAFSRSASAFFSK